MGNLATTYLQQARGFLRAGDPQRAIELLEKAMVLAGEDGQAVQQILQEMAGACTAAGRYEQADRCRQRLDALGPSSPAMQPAGIGPITLPMARKSRWPVVIGIIVAVLVLLAGAVVVTVVVMQSRFKAELSAAALTPAQVPPSPESEGMAPAGIGQVSQTPTVTAAASATARMGRQELLKDTVGLVIVMLKYEGTASGKTVSYEIPWSTGTAFAVHPSGVMLTNKHVIEPINSTDIPPTLQDLGMPTLVLRERYLLICFGPQAKDRYVGKLLHQSVKFDLAVLKAGRKFATPLMFASQVPKQKDPVYVCGYPGVVQEVWDQTAGPSARMSQIQQKWRQTGHVQTVETLGAGSFDSALTKGIVVTAERNIDSVSYLQTDAAIRQGYSGGPAINEQNEVVGILTMGVKEGSTGALANYNFALLIDQLRDEIDHYLQDH